jgi:hypothetical protein
VKSGSSLPPALLLFALAGCFTEGPPLSLHRETDDDAGTNPHISVPSGAPDAMTELPPQDPHAVLGVDPSHGPFSGGQARIVRGSGFTSKVRVWFGATEVPHEDLVPVDPAHVQVIVPSGAPGPVDVRAQIADDASTSRTLYRGYVYESFYAEPATGPTSGGTFVHLHGKGTQWTAGTEVRVDDRPCTKLEIVSAEEIVCTSPKNTPGAKSIAVTTPGLETTTVFDAFTYADSDNGFKGGLSGAALAADLKVLVYNSITGDPVPGALVLAGDDVGTGLQSVADASGVVLFHDPALAPKRSVTVAAKCFQPTTFVDVPVDTVTVYLDPVLSPACNPGGDPPSVGGRTSTLAEVAGELVWPESGEFKMRGWTNVPGTIGTDEKLSAYVFMPSGDPTTPFALPDSTRAAVPEIVGTVGYPFRVDAFVGNLTLYALAGIENRTVFPTRFTAYAMGILRGVSTAPGAITTDVYIPIDIPLDHALSMHVTTPATGSRGPDRATFSAAVELNKGSYAILPAGKQTSFLPLTPTVSFVGLPSLSGGLSSSRYVATALAGTGPALSAPMSSVGQFATTTEDLTLDPFVPVPELTHPAYGGAWDGRRLTVEFAPVGGMVDLVVYTIQSADGLVTWTIAAPAAATDIRLPGIAEEDGGLAPGPLSITVYLAHIVGFDYGKLVYRQLTPRGFDAYALDVFSASL